MLISLITSFQKTSRGKSEIPALVFPVPFEVDKPFSTVDEPPEEEVPSSEPKDIPTVVFYKAFSKVNSVPMEKTRVVTH